MQKPPNTYTVKVPTKPYLRKYIASRYGSPLQLTSNNTIGVLISCLLEKDYHSINMYHKKKGERLSYMTDVIEVAVPMSMMTYKGFSLNSDKIIAINRFLENTFVEDLHRYCNSHKKARDWRPGIDEAIYAFAEIYAIEMEVDITFEALKKAEYRLRKKAGSSSNTFVPPPAKPMQWAFC